MLLMLPPSVADSGFASAPSLCVMLASIGRMSGFRGRQAHALWIKVGGCQILASRVHQSSPCLCWRQAWSAGTGRPC